MLAEQTASAPKPPGLFSGTDLARGLTAAEARERLVRLGPNEIPRAPPPSLLRKALEHGREPMNLLLIGAALVAALFLGEPIDATAIVAIVLLNIAITLAQEAKARRSLDALQALQTPTARVLRDGVTLVVPARDVVRGDVLVLVAGDLVPADTVLVEAHAVEADESTLTGESLPVEKRASTFPAQNDRTSFVFSGSVITAGVGRGIVWTTGGDTELGAIAAHLQELQPPTPLQVELGRVTARLGIAALVLAAAAFGLIMVANGTDASIERAFLAAVALAVAAVPEGLATIVTVALALGVRRMAEQGAVVRVLPAVETLGSTDVIVTDKTGTLTRNHLEVVSVLTASGTELLLDALRTWTGYPLLTRAAVLCNDADASGVAQFDPLESALLSLADPATVARIRGHCPRVDVAPFDPKTKVMSTVNLCEGGPELFVKGAPEVVVPLAVLGIGEEGPFPLDEAARENLLAATAKLAATGARLIALANRRVTGEAENGSPMEQLTLVGVAALRDPVRPEARSAVEEAQGAGVRIVMVTGDHPGTATAIAGEVGIEPSGAVLPESPQARQVATNVLARALPEDKVRVVEALRAQGHVVAVTGDGVNDVPALSRADIGVAMGRSGTDAAREAADLVITDDNLATIVTAVREGRGIYDNIRKVIDYLVAANLSEIIVVVACLIAIPAVGIPLTPLQILWINLITDGLPAVALGVQPIAPEVMQRRPRSREQKLLTGRRIRTLLGRGAVIATASVGALLTARYVFDEGWGVARTTMFATLAGAQLFYSWVVADRGHMHPAGTNRSLLIATAVGIALLVAVIVVPALRPIFDTGQLTPALWLTAAACSAFPGFLLKWVIEERRRA